MSKVLSKKFNGLFVLLLYWSKFSMRKRDAGLFFLSSNSCNLFSADVRTLSTLI